MDTNKEQLKKVAETTKNEDLKQSINNKLSEYDKKVEK